MPTIEVTQEQYDAYTNGKTITVEPKATDKHVAVHKSGHVYLLRGPVDNAEWRVIRNSNDAGSGFETWQSFKFDFARYDDSYTIVPVAA